jgi:hypothetical protein
LSGERLTGPGDDIEAKARLGSVLDVLEHEARALEALQDERLVSVLQAITTLQAEIVAALTVFVPLSANGHE